MSRIDEALRRAAETSATPSETGEPSPASPEMHPATLAREPFPLEMTPRPSLLRSVPAPAASAPTAPPIPPAPPPPAPPPPAPAGAAPETSEAPAGEAQLFDCHFDETLAEKIVVDGQMDPGSREQYRRLAAALHHAQGSTGAKVVMIASAVQREGKTLTATNLALTLSESYQRRVLLIDADLRRPALHKVFGLDNTSGLHDGLTVVEPQRLAVKRVRPGLFVLPAGNSSTDPIAGLTSDRMRRLITEARQGFDWVIIDTPPVVLLPDANLLATMVDSVIVVVKAESTPYDLVKRALAAIGRDRIAGVVLNSAQATPSADYGYYASGYFHKADPVEP